MAVGVVIEALDAALPEQGAAGAAGGDTGTGEPGFVVEDSACLGAAQESDRLAE